jgi:hypothetical protein
LRDISIVATLYTAPRASHKHILVIGGELQAFMPTKLIDDIHQL